MNLNDKDKQILEHIVRYCDEVNEAHTIFKYNKELFMNTPTYRNGCSMPIMQIGELVKKLSKSFINADKKMPWKEIKGMRDIFAHGYSTMNKEMIWNTSIDDIPVLKNHVFKILNDSKNVDELLNKSFTR